MMFAQARSRSVLMGLDSHMITGTVPALLPGFPLNTPDMTSCHAWTPANRTNLDYVMAPPGGRLFKSPLPAVV
jgi:hypothetical protein